MSFLTKRAVHASVFLNAVNDAMCTPLFMKSGERRGGPARVFLVVCCVKPLPLPLTHYIVWKCKPCPLPTPTRSMHTHTHTRARARAHTGETVQPTHMPVLKATARVGVASSSAAPPSLHLWFPAQRIVLWTCGHCGQCADTLAAAHRIVLWTLGTVSDPLAAAHRVPQQSK